MKYHCPKCRKNLDETHYHHSTSRPNRRQGYCKQCDKQRNRKPTTHNQKETQK